MREVIKDCIKKCLFLEVFVIKLKFILYMDRIGLELK